MTASSPQAIDYAETNIGGFAWQDNDKKAEAAGKTPSARFDLPTIHMLLRQAWDDGYREAVSDYAIDDEYPGYDSFEFLDGDD